MEGSSLLRVSYVPGRWSPAQQSGWSAQDLALKASSSE